MRMQRRTRKETSEAQKLSILLGNTVREDGSERKTVYHLMSEDPAKLSLSNFLAHETSDPLEPPSGFTRWMRQATFAVELYEPELLASADARTTIDYNGRPRSVINLCSYNYLGLANHPEVIAAAQEALKTHGLGACGSPMLSGMTDLHRELERQVAKFLGREDAMLFNSGFGGALGTISGLLRKNDVAILDNRSHLSLRDGAALSRCRADKFEHNDPASLDKALARKQGRRQLVVMEGIYSCRRCSISQSRTGRVFLSMKRTRCSPAANMVAAPRKNSVWKVAYRLFTAHFQKLLARWADLWPGRKRPFVTCVFTRTRMFIRALCHPLWWRRS
jgi:hypothetical protein